MATLANNAFRGTSRANRHAAMEQPQVTASTTYKTGRATSPGRRDSMASQTQQPSDANPQRSTRLVADIGYRWNDTDTPATSFDTVFRPEIACAAKTW